MRCVCMCVCVRAWVAADDVSDGSGSCDPAISDRPPAERTPHFRALNTHKQKNQRNRNEKRRLHPVGAQTKTQDRKMVLRHGGAPLVAESEIGRLPECTG